MFAAGDDRYTISIPAVRVIGGEARVRVSAERERTVMHNGARVVIRSTALTAFAVVRESDGWKIGSEGPLSEEIADELLAASPVERDRILADPENVTVIGAARAREPREPAGDGPAVRRSAARARAGISTLAIGRWPADGFAIDSVLTRVHEELANSTPPAEALRAAIASARGTNGDAPSAWGGLRLIGAFR